MADKPILAMAKLFWRPVFFGVSTFMMREPWLAGVMGILTGWSLLDALCDTGLTPHQWRTPSPADARAPDSGEGK